MKEKPVFAAVAALQINKFFNSSNPKIQNIIENASYTTDVVEQQQCIKIFAAYANRSASSEDKECVLKILAFIYIFTTPKIPIKKTVGRILSNFKDHDLLAKIIACTIEMILEIVASQEKDPNTVALYRDAVFSGLSTSMDLKPVVAAINDNVDVVFVPAFAFLLDVVDVLWERKSGSSVLAPHKYQYIYNTSKFLLNILQKSGAKAIKEQDRLGLILCCYNIMNHAHVTYDTKSNCAYITILLFAALPENILNECTFKEYPYFEFFKFGNEHSPALEKLGIKIIEDTVIFETFKVCIYSAVMIVSPCAALFNCTFNKESIFSIAFQELIEFAKRSKGNPVQIMGIAKAINNMSSHLHAVPLDKANSIIKHGLNYVVIYVDDRAESVRNNIKAVFKNFIKLAVKYRDEGMIAALDNPKLLQMILEWLKNLKGGGFYKALVAFASEVGFTVLLDSIPDLPKQLLGQLIHPSKAHNICSCYEILMELHLKEVSEDDWVKYWVTAIVAELKTSKPPLTEFFQRLFVSAFKMRPVALKAITQECYLNTDSELGAFLSCIHYARKSGLKLSVDNLYARQIDQENFWRNLVEYKTMNVLMTYQNNEIRTSILAMIVESHKSTEAFTEWELQVLTKFLRYNINTPSASMRQQIVSYTEKAMHRMGQNSLKSQNFISNSKYIDNLKPLPTLEGNTALYSTFWNDFFREVILPGLNPDCNHSRKSACLELLCYASGFYTAPFVLGYFKSKDISNLKYILQYDTYEQNKEMAALLLVKCEPEIIGFAQEALLAKYVDECFDLVMSKRPSETISAAYMLKVACSSPHMRHVILQRLCRSITNEKLREMTVSERFFGDTTCMLLFQLIFELKECFKVGERNLQEAVASKPLHGILFCIRHILNIENLSNQVKMPYWKILIKDLLYWCYQLSEVVNPIICNQSPEGFLPDNSDIDLPESDETAMAQMVTVYGWRAAKEISLLLGELAWKAPFCDNYTDGLINENQLRSIGTHMFYLLLNTKHRGAFEQASIGFSSLCSRMWRLPISSTVPAEWLDKILNVILGMSDENMDTCATRRSAGVPFMVQAILTTEPDSDGNKHFHSCMNILLEVAGDSTRPEDQRTHCMNILRALYRNNQLGEAVLSYCSKGVIISVEGFGNSSWSIRNSATLLFSALMVRIFGVQRVRATEIISIKNKMIAQVFFTRYPELYSFLVQKLEEGTTNVHHPSLFPVLLLLSRLYHCPGSTDMFQLQLQVFLPYMEFCFANPVYRIRDLAAKIFVNLISPEQAWRYIVGSFVCLANTRILNNHCHGLLLQLQYLLLSQERQLPRLNIEKVFDNTAWILLCCGQQISHVTSALYLEILIHLIRHYDPHFDNSVLFNKILSVIQWLTRTSNYSQMVSTAAKKFKMYIFNLKLCVILSMLKCNDCRDNATKLKISRQYIYEELQMHRELQNLSLSYINYIKFSTCEYEKHDLYEDDDSEHWELIDKFLKPLNPVFKTFLYQVLYEALKRILATQKVEDTAHLEILIIHNFPGCLKQHDMCNIKQWLLEYNINCCNRSDEHIVRICIAWLDNFVSGLQEMDIELLNLNNLIDMLIKFSAPVTDASYRLGVARLLVGNKRLFYQKYCILSWSNVSMLWEMVFVLLEDDAEEVRNTICELCQQDLTLTEIQYTLAPKIRTLTPEFAREVLFHHMVKIIPYNCSINILLSLTLRTAEVTNNNLSVVFEEGTSNAYSELYPTARVAAEVLHKILWKMNDGLHFDDKSIYIEEQTLVVATTLYNKFYGNRVPLVSAAMNTAMRNILAKMILFLQKETVNQAHFKCHLISIMNLALNAKEIKFLDASEETRLKMFLSVVFKLALWT